MCSTRCDSLPNIDSQPGLPHGIVFSLLTLFALSLCTACIYDFLSLKDIVRVMTVLDIMLPVCVSLGELGQ